MNAVFLDTVGILALLERSDQWHADPTRAWAALSAAARPVRTTTLVLLECGNGAARKPYRRRVDDLRREFQADGALLAPSDSDVEAGWAAYERGEAGNAGIVDLISFAFMWRLGIRQVFSSDAHFKAAGFETLF